jgi:hypothetical protein
MPSARLDEFHLTTRLGDDVDERVHRVIENLWWVDVTRGLKALVDDPRWVLEVVFDEHRDLRRLPTQTSRRWESLTLKEEARGPSRAAFRRVDAWPKPTIASNFSGECSPRHLRLGGVLPAG